MNAAAETDIENARRREGVLRELNLFPLWQLRVPLQAESVAEARDVDVVAAPVAKAIKPVVADQPVQADCSTMDWAELKQTVQACTACSLRAGCTQTVLGMGDATADWLFVGSWPTEDDDAQGSPFAGQAGVLLDNMLAAIKLKRGVNVYLSNVVKCTGAIRRGPQPEQIVQCTPYLSRQIQLLQPKLIVVLGHAAATSMLGEDREWNNLLGKVHDYCGMEKNHPHAPIPLIITHHPAALLLSPLNKAQTWRDLCLARDTMAGLVANT